MGIATRSTLWLQVWGLAAVQGAISLTWLIYRLYLPKLLTQFGLPPGLDRLLFIIEDLIAMVMEPVMGGLSDRAQHWVGTRFPLISMGVVAAASLFIGIPAIVLLGQPTQLLQGVLLVVVVGWALAMAAFRSPVICLLGMYATVPSLPQAASVLMFVGGLVGALRPLASGFLLGLGSALTFTIGSASLLGATAVLREVHPPSLAPADPATLGTPSQQRRLSSPLPWLTLIMLLITGMGAAWGVRLLLGEIFPRLFKAGLPNMQLPLLMGIVSIALGVAAVPLGLLASRIGNQRLMLASFVTTIATLGMASLSRQPWAVGIAAIVLVAAASVILNGVIPLALSVTPPERGGLGIGTYFGGFTAGMALFNAIIAKSADLSDGQTIMLAIAAFVIASVGVFFAGSDRQSSAL